MKNVVLIWFKGQGQLLLETLMLGALTIFKTILITLNKIELVQ